MSLWDVCPDCVQLGIDNPSIYDALRAVAQEQRRETLAVAVEFFTNYHAMGHHEETTAA